MFLNYMGHIESNRTICVFDNTSIRMVQYSFLNQFVVIFLVVECRSLFRCHLRERTIL